jgi:hypothetical protein
MIGMMNEDGQSTVGSGAAQLRPTQKLKHEIIAVKTSDASVSVVREARKHNKVFRLQAVLDGEEGIRVGMFKPTTV